MPSEITLSDLTVSINDKTQETLADRVASKVEAKLKKDFGELLNDPISRKMYLTKKEACIYLSVSYATLQRLIAQGLPLISIESKILISKSSIDNFMKSIEK